MILFRDNIGYKFKGLYGYHSELEYIKIYGIGPKVIQQSMIDKLLK